MRLAEPETATWERTAIKLCTFLIQQFTVRLKSKLNRPAEPRPLSKVKFSKPTPLVVPIFWAVGLGHMKSRCSGCWSATPLAVTAEIFTS